MSDSMSDYVCYYGTHQGEPAGNYDDLLGLECEEREDDGAIAYTVPRDQDCGWNEGRCPCGGVMKWAEAGYIPWHRICGHCGSHWELHPVVAYPPHWELDRDEYALNPDAPGNATVVVERLRASIRRTPLTDQEREHGAIYGSWARRARVYSR